MSKANQCRAIKKDGEKTVKKDKYKETKKRLRKGYGKVEVKRKNREEEEGKEKSSEG